MMHFQLQIWSTKIWLNSYSALYDLPNSKYLEFKNNILSEIGEEMAIWKELLSKSFTLNAFI